MKVLIAALAAFGTTSALPQQQTSSVSTAPTATPTYVTPQDNTKLLEELANAPSTLTRFKRLLTVDGKGEKLLEPQQLAERTVFDFNNAKPNNGAKGGATKSANIETFPILSGLGLSTTVGFLTGCGMNTPHVHPRATEFLTVVEGSLNFGYILENGLVSAGQNAEINGTLAQFQGTVFPIGSVHYQFNPTCDNATFVATLDNADPGTSQMAQTFFGLNPDVVNATLGFPKAVDGKDIESFRKLIPANIALAVEECVRRCGL
ncbi:RmlC-like cupin [Aaosphaeria arxii CBS 175.79]|uniref:RmlC-like cupin n=1 Tax=Aaosphaeria arxii CBS 175.79 TaxID=1450172 RepID=A0A6A5XGM9_9PLEO|nr:RmlC-like cupin [Aaosphaeria arxii CBS 175.79]KAF2012242.1 RmlC-like cupin [Aaosphaeria arxii CBS 175.79]